MEAWRALYFAERLRRAHGRCQPLPDQESDQPPKLKFSGLWGLSESENQMVPPSVLVRHGLHKPTTRAQASVAWQDPDLNVQEAPGRYDQVNGDWSRLPEGCHGQKKHVCRIHKMTREVAARHNALARVLSAFTDSRKAKLSSSSCLALVSGREEAAGEVTKSVFVLLVSARMSPKVQYWAHCHLVDDNAAELVHTRDLPFDIEIAFRPHRFPGNDTERVINILSSDELVTMFMQHAQTFEVAEVDYDIDCIHHSLLRMTVKGFQATFEKAVSQRHARRAKPFDILPPEFDFGDPCDAQSGARFVGGNGGVFDPAAGASPGDDPWDVVDDGDLEDLREPFNNDRVVDEGLGDEAEDDDSSDEGGVLLEEDFRASADDAPAAVNAGEAEGVEVMEALVANLEGQAEEAVGADLPPSGPPSVEDLVRSATISDLGYVTTTLHPFSKMRAVGRITSWPEAKPMQARSVSMRCNVHSKCSFVKAHRLVTDGDLLSWLFCARVVENAAENQVAGAEHMALAKSGGYPKIQLPSEGGTSSGSRG